MDATIDPFFGFEDVTHTRYFSPCNSINDPRAVVSAGAANVVADDHLYPSRREPLAHRAEQQCKARTYLRISAKLTCKSH